MDEMTEKVIEFIKMRDEVSDAIFGLSYTEAVLKQVCLSCKEPIKDKLKTDEDEDIYGLFGFCPNCKSKSNKIPTVH